MGSFFNYFRPDPEVKSDLYDQMIIDGFKPIDTYAKRYELRCKWPHNGSFRYLILDSKRKTALLENYLEGKIAFWDDQYIGWTTANPKFHSASAFLFDQDSFELQMDNVTPDHFGFMRGTEFKKTILRCSMKMK